MRSDSAYDFSGTARFQVLRRIGGGGMGVVYEVFDRERSQRVALKTLRTLDATAVLRFKNEFRWLQDLNHPNLVSFGELFSEEGQWFFTMELVEGVDFLTWVRGEEPAAAAEPPSHAHAHTLSLEDGRKLHVAMAMADAAMADAPVRFDDERLRAALGQLARALNTLHSAQKVHRDIKPPNVLVTPKGRVVLLDFGLAKEFATARSGPQSDSHVVGTVDYMAPEQAASKPVGPEADWYSVGTVLYQALTGSLPFSGPPLEVLIAKQSQSPSPPRALNPQAPADLDALCSQLLKADPAARPSGAQVLKRLGIDDSLEQHVQPISSHPSSAPFVGRQREMEILGAALADTHRGDPVTVYVQGESGVGKSALVRRFTDSLAVERTDVVVLSGRCYERESVPYKAFDGIVDSLSRYMMRLPKAEAAAILPLKTALLAQVFPVLRRVEVVAQTPLPRNEVPSPQELRARVFAALRELFSRLAERHPLMLVVDDLPWADADSLALLGEVMRPPEAPSLLLIATVRVAGDSNSSGKGGSLNVASAITGDVRHVHVQRLPPEEARQLVTLLLGSAKQPADAIKAIADEAAGHPLFIDELVRHVSSGGEGSGPHGSRLKLDEALWARVSRLEQPARHLLELVVVAGGPVVQETASAAAAIDFGEFGKRVALLRVANLVKTTGARRTDAIEPYHDRVREAVLQHLDSATRKRWHERLALALEAAGRADPEALSVHWFGAGDLERAAHYASVAAQQAAEALAFERAARLYRRAIELRPVEGAALQAALGAVLVNAGRGGDAALAFLEAAKGASAAESIDLQRRAAEQLLILGHVDAGLSALGRVLETFDMSLPKSPKEALRSLMWQRLRIRLRGLRFKKRDATQVSPAELTRIDICWSVGVGLGLVDNIRGADFSARNLLYALKAGEPYRVARALATEAVYASQTGQARRSAEILATIEQLAKETNQPHAVALAAMSAGISAFLDGRWTDGRARLESAETILRERCTGVAWEIDTTHILTLTCLYFLGDLRVLVERVARHLRSAIDRGDLFASTNLRTGMSVVWLLRDEPESAREQSTEGMRKWSRDGFHTQHYYDLIAQVQASLYLGEGEAALKLYDERWPALEESGQVRVQLVRAQTRQLRARALLAVAKVDAGDRPRLLGEVDALADKLSAEGRDWITAQADLLRAAAAAGRGETERAVSAIDLATRGFVACNMALHAAVARCQHGRMIGGDEGRALVEAGTRWLEGQRVKSPMRLSTMIAPGFPDW